MAKRRSNGEGSFWQLPDRTWVHQITLGRKEDGSLIRKAAPRRSARSGKKSGWPSRLH